MNREPLVSAASITALVSAVVAVLAAFGLDLSQDQTAALVGLVAVVAPLIVALVVRPKVTPVADPRTVDGVPLIPVGSTPPPPEAKEI